MIRLVKGYTSLPTIQQASAVPSSWMTELYAPGEPIRPITNEHAPLRDIDYPIAANITPTPRIAYGLLPFPTIKSAYDAIMEVSSPIHTIVREMLGFEPQLVDGNGNVVFDHPYQWLVESPDREMPFDVWLTRFLKDTLIYDTGTLLVQQSHGSLVSLDYIDGSTLTVLVNERGRMPKANEVSQDAAIQSRYVEKARAWFAKGNSLPATTPAFVQIIHGSPFSWWDQDQIYYRPRSRTVDTPYGESFIERAFTWINIVANLTGFELAHYRTGNMPEGWGETPEGWTREQITSWENTFNARMTSGPTERMRVRFLPHGFNYHETKKPKFEKDLYDQAADNIGLMLGLPPSEHGKVPGQGLGGKGFGEAMESSLFRNGLFPIRSYVKSVLNAQLERFGVDDVTVDLALPTQDVDPDKQKEAIKGLFASGIYTLNDALGELGKDQVPGGDIHIITSGGQIVVIEDYLKQRAEGQVPQPQSRSDIEQSKQLLDTAAKNGSLSTKTYSIPVDKKINPEQAQYTPNAPDERQECRLCKYFLSGNQCEIVRGVVAPGGTCKHFEAAQKPETTVSKVVAPIELLKHCGVCPEDDEYFDAPLSRSVTIPLPIDHHANGAEIVAMCPAGLPPKAAIWKAEGDEVEALQERIGGPQYVREEAAYLIDRSLGFFLVPVAYVADCCDEYGAAIMYSFDMQPALAPTQYASEWIEKAAVLDSVLCQQDRGAHNWGTHPDDPTRPILFDNGLCLPPSGTLCNSGFFAARGFSPLSEPVRVALTLCLRDASMWCDVAALVGIDAAASAKTRIQQMLIEGRLCA